MQTLPFLFPVDFVWCQSYVTSSSKALGGPWCGLIVQKGRRTRWYINRKPSWCSKNHFCMYIGRKCWGSKFSLFAVGKSPRILAKIAIILITPLAIISIFTSLDSSWQKWEVGVIRFHCLTLCSLQCCYSLPAYTLFIPTLIKSCQSKIDLFSSPYSICSVCFVFTNLKFYL